MRSAETCIYTAHFGESFTGCPLFQPVSFTPTTWTGLPLNSHVACRHLEIAGIEDRGPFYPRCGLGGPKAVGRLAAQLRTATG
jgi:hypothetical protein